MDRHPAVAGQFYPGHAETLRRALESLLPAVAEKQKAIGLMVPHAGYVYSGAIAGATFARVRIPERVVIFGPNHHGVGAEAAIYPGDRWLTPLGPVTVDATLTSRLIEDCPGLTADEAAHRYEHSLEVQVPFIQVENPQASIVPICIGHLRLDELLSLGSAIGASLACSGEEILLVASSDMTHYEPGEIAREKDQRALARVLALDPAGLYRTVREGRISMCGVLPTALMLAAAKELGASDAALVRYGNSGDVTGDQAEVVGYAGVVIS